MGSITNQGKDTKPKVYVLDPYHEDAIDLLHSNKELDIILPSESRKDRWRSDATAVFVRSETRITASDLDEASSGLKCIIKQGVGVDNIDLKAAKAKGVKVFNTPGLNSEAVAELAFTLALCVSRRVCEFDRKIRNGEKTIRSQMLGVSLYKKTLGIVGMGNIGREVAKKWVGAMGGHVIAYDPYAPESAWQGHINEAYLTKVDKLDDLLRDSDVVSLHVPLTNSTKSLISTRELHTMKRNSILLNCARGGIVDEAALLEALQTGHLFGAGLDALQYEPPTLSRYGDSLLSCPQVVMTPHVGASTVESQAQSGIAAVQILFDIMSGKGEVLSKSLA